METHQGSCLCGSVRYTTQGPLRGVSVCHCSQCRKQSGHVYATVSVSEEALSVEGASNLTWFRSSENAKRGFCRVCGSALFWKHDDENQVSILAGSLEGATGLSISRHIYCADKGDYYEIDDDKPQVP
ncbi:GFA family protein [Hoeflea sp. WL0058]|uniref:GFA family protein n=1 Tax=Flavimaribacter sediminis TaxID=2865987 RepID=A0AAE2ZHN5_9HYPH|nr:GFA family protein [Flavimaribacter sediminis]MBW8636431.1 GFA family protein [Flavimaribacter sediminis]